ncbi:monooxygenase [Dichotomopilus funicola]|uniref:Monooxygenase n=1 Tax=Dichotomopilus funicola TaxID=1934379 RepID=A0AAN6UVU7_9PEZI|nr:monooxygenase [Dichotomopilus funicola]
MPSATPAALRIAVIGTGPGGLSSAIALSELPNVSVRVYESAPALKTHGAGISVNHNGFKVLELLGAREGVTGASTNPTVQRNAYTGEIVDPGVPHDPEDKYEARRVRRLVLQESLIARVPKGLIEFNKKLVSLEDLEDDGVRAIFADGTDTTVDLVVGADGIRSVVRKHMVPDYPLAFTHQVGWRTLVPVELLQHIPDLPLTTTSWWRGAAKSVWLSPVDELSNLKLMEFSVRTYNEPYIEGKTVSWGMPVSGEKVLSRFKDLDPRLVEAIKQVPEGGWMEFASYAGPSLDTSVAWGKLVLVGDSSHPSAGGFGSGSAFAMEDSWILARAIEHARKSTDTVADTVVEALRIFDTIRVPFYKSMNAFRESQKENIKKMAQAVWDDFDAELRRRFASDGLGVKRGQGFLSFVYSGDIGKTWKEFVESEKARNRG